MNIRKFTEDNMEYYIQFLAEIRQIPLKKLKFLDESYFDPRRLHKNWCLAPKG
jgi:hypothetical protein